MGSAGRPPGPVFNQAALVDCTIFLTDCGSIWGGWGGGVVLWLNAAWVYTCNTL